jgi:hypothetical protein
VLAIWLAVGGRGAVALNAPDQFCTGNPCVISSPKGADPNILLDFGTRTVVLQSTLELLPQVGGAIGWLTIKAGSFSIVGNGQIKGSSSTQPAGTVTIEVANSIQIDDTLFSGAVRLSGQDGGTLTLTTASGSVNGGGRIALFGDGTQASGGTLAVNAAGGVNLTGRLDIGGGAQGGGGSFDLTAAGNVSVPGDIDLAGGTDGGGTLDISAGGSLTLGAVDMSGSGEDGDGGDAFISAGGAVTLLGVFDGRGSDASANCGDGASVDISAGGDITIAAEIRLQGRGLDCTGGALELDGAGVFVQRAMDLSGTGPEGSGGELAAYSITRIQLAAPIALDGGEGGAGDFCLDGDGDVEINADINAQGRTSTSPGGASGDITGATLNISAGVDTSGGSAAVAGADLTLTGCDVITQPSAVLKSIGSAGSITVVARDALTLRGRFTASPAGGNTLRYSQKANPPDTAGTIFSPPATNILDRTLIPCGALCDTSADCDDGDGCTDDICDNFTACLHPPRSGACEDGNPCTSADTCVAGTCVGTPIVGCVDRDRDGKPDDVDECTTLAWTPRPTTPPDQNPVGFSLLLGRLAAAGAAQTILLKGRFNVAPSSVQAIDPGANGVHVHVEDARGPLFDVNLPGGAGCAAADGWITYGAGSSATWLYHNESGAVPPGCAPGSARGIRSVQIKDRRATHKAALQFKIKAKNASLLRVPDAPLTKLQASLALGAQPAPGIASPQAEAGQCAEALFTGNPIPTSPRPYCKPKLKDAATRAVLCKGE